MALILDESKDMPAYCKPYYYIGIRTNVKENFKFSKKSAKIPGIFFSREIWYSEAKHT